MTGEAYIYQHINNLKVSIVGAQKNYTMYFSGVKWIWDSEYAFRFLLR
jgi:hypothetical protein